MSRAGAHRPGRGIRVRRELAGYTASRFWYSGNWCYGVKYYFISRRLCMRSSPMIRRPYYNSRAPVTRERVLAFLAERRLAQARTLCARLCAARKKNPPAWTLLGRIDAQLGRWPAAEQSLRRAVELEPGNADAWHGLGRAVHHQGRYAEAEDAYRQALRLGLSDANNVLVDLGAVCYGQRKLMDAEDCFRRAAELRPQDSETHFRLAEICEQTHRPTEARHAAEAACRLNAGHHRARLLLARLHRHAGALANARSLAEDVLKTAERPLASLATIELGHILDSAGEYRRAFVHLARGQREFSETFGAGIDRQSYPREIARNRAWFTAQRVVGWERDPAPDDRPDPVFLVGFPRSGTTLTERILSSHSAVTCLDERPLLDMLITELPGGPDHDTAYPDCLTDLSTAQIQALRTRYHELSAAARGAADGGLLVDKFPLNLVHLGLVARLFPNARVLMALRDPRDVCLSCFMQVFQPNKAMIHFTALEDTARLYKTVMGLWLHYRSVLRLQVYESRYEELVTDPEPHVRALIDFLGMEWEEDVLYFYRPDKHRFASTPSNLAVTQPIHRRAVGRWRHYEPEFREASEILAPLITEFGYERD